MDQRTAGRLLAFGVLAAAGLLCGLLWIVTSQAAAECSSSLGQIGQAVSSSTRSNCSFDTTLHTIAGALAMLSGAGAIVAAAARRA